MGRWLWAVSEVPQHHIRGRNELVIPLLLGLAARVSEDPFNYAAGGVISGSAAC